MNIRRASVKDTDAVMRLLSQVLEIHAKIRPDVFIPGTTKYSPAELAEIFADDMRPVYVAVNDKDEVLGYCFCMIREQPNSANMIPFTSVYIDDLCVDETARGMHIGEALFEYTKQEAKKLGCYEVYLNVWEGNDAKQFYERMGMKVKNTYMEYIL